MTSTASLPVAAALESGRHRVHAAVADLTDQVARLRPEADAWSVLECLEHLVVVEERFPVRIEGAGSTDVPQPSAEREARLAATVADRSQKVSAPELARPTGRFAGLGEALAAFDRARDATVQLVRTRGAGLYDVKVAHPVMGDVNGVELAQILDGHAHRHVAQILETRARLDS